MLDTTRLNMASPAVPVQALHDKKVCRRHRPQVQDGVRTAVLKALTGARLYRDGTFPTLRKAALACGSNVPYVAAANTILDTGDERLMDLVLHGGMALPFTLLDVAHGAKIYAKLVKAYQQANASDLARFGRAVGADDVFDRVVCAAIDDDA